MEKRKGGYQTENLARAVQRGAGCVWRGPACEPQDRSRLLARLVSCLWAYAPTGQLTSSPVIVQREG